MDFSINLVKMERKKIIHLHCFEVNWNLSDAAACVFFRPSSRSEVSVSSDDSQTSGCDKIEAHGQITPAHLSLRLCKPWQY